MATEVTIQDAIGVLRRSLAGEVTIEEANTLFSSLSNHSEQSVQDALHAAVHFLTDADVRQSDPEYDRLQRVRLAEKLDALHRLAGA